ncbi:MAG: alpha-L-rhamnosidase C-terminal domain-containing protein [Phycisphaerales bacterium]|nr:alpha-L-rhamnosidase C-terminal domain-containing protein [Phycisphaerales bacterium]
MTVRRVRIDNIPFAEHRRSRGLWRRGHWPASWIAPSTWSAGQPLVFACRKRWEQPAAGTVRVHVSADERYALFVDGKLVGRGPERGDLNHWYFETYDLELSAGNHGIVGLVWVLGSSSPVAQISAGPGFLLAADAPRDQHLSTGQPGWEILQVRGFTVLHFPDLSHDGFTGKKLRLDGRLWPWGVEHGAGEGWLPADIVGPATSDYPPERLAGRSLVPAALPPMLWAAIPPPRCRFAETDAPDWRQIDQRICDPGAHDPVLASEIEQMLRGRGAVIVPPRQRIRAVLDLGEYFCAYPELELSGGSGAIVRLAWAESLYDFPPGVSRSKGDRNQTAGKYFRGFADEFIADGGRERIFRTLWWQAGRYLQLFIETREEPLQLHRLELTETRFDLPEDGSVLIEGPAWGSALPLCRRSVQTCAHEVLADSPYYEQLNYVGDARLQVLCHLTSSRDDRLARKTIQLIDASRLPDGFTQSRYPSRVVQVIPGYSLLWVEMVRDLFWWRPSTDFIRDRLTGCRTVLAAFARHLNDKGLLAGLPGWNFVDWSPDFPGGEVPGDDPSANAIANLQFLCALHAAAELERAVGIPALGDHYAAEAHRLAEAVRRTFWDSRRRLIADDASHSRYSEHAQALAILAGLLESHQCRPLLEALADPPGDLAAATVYFVHYVVEALRSGSLADAISRRLKPWADFVRVGLRCTPEGPEPSRSDCHGWSAHPRFHVAATIVGIRPAEPGFAAVEFRPMLPSDAISARAVVPHPRGVVEGQVCREAGGMTLSWQLPEGVPARIVMGRTAHELSSTQGKLTLSS